MIGKAVQTEHEGTISSLQYREIEAIGVNRSPADMARGRIVLRRTPGNIGVPLFGRRSGGDHGWCFLPFAALQSMLRGSSQQIDDVGFVFERTRIGLYEAMIDGDLADLIELVFADADISESAR